MKNLTLNMKSFLNSTVIAAIIGILPTTITLATNLHDDHAVSLVPSVFGSIEDNTPDGIGDTIFTFVPGAINNASSLPTSTPLAISAIVEYNVSSLVGFPKITAILDGIIFVNNALDTGERLIDILVFKGDGVLSPSDFQIPATIVGTVSYSPPFDLSVSFRLDVSNIVQSLIDGGSNFIGVRFAGLNQQASSVLSENTPPILEITVVPEPFTILGSVLAISFGTFFKRNLQKSRA